MATAPTIQILSGGKAKAATWNLVAGESGDPIEDSIWADRSVQVFGDFGTGGAVSIEGSNDGVNWALLDDPQGSSLVFSSAKIESVLEITRFIRPVVSGDGATNLNIVLFGRGN